MLKAVLSLILLGGALSQETIQVQAVPESENLKPNEPASCSTNPSLEALIYQLLLSSLAQRPVASPQLLLQPIEPKPLAAFTTKVILIERPLTVTETLQTVLPVWYRNQRVLSTVNELKTHVITETTTQIVTETLTAPKQLGVSFNEIRRKRQAEEIEPSFVLSDEISTEGTNFEFQAAWRRIEENLSKRQPEPEQENMSAEEREATRMTTELLKMVDFQSALRRIEQGVQSMVEKFVKSENNEIER